MTGAPRSFIDVLFILLLGTIVMLTQTVHVGKLDTDLLRRGGGGVSPVGAEDVVVVVITADALRYDRRAWPDVETLAAALPARAPVLLLVSDADVRHRRVVEIWARLSEAGLAVSLGTGIAAADVPAPGREP